MSCDNGVDIEIIIFSSTTNPGDLPFPRPLINARREHGENTAGLAQVNNLGEIKVNKIKIVLCKVVQLGGPRNFTTRAP